MNYPHIIAAAICLISSTISAMENKSRQAGNINNIKDFKPFYEATLRGETEILHLLPKTIKPLTDKKPTALHIAIELGHKAYVRKFIENEIIPVDAVTSNRATPLLMAVIHGDKDTIELLLEKNASVNVKDYKQFTPLHHAAMKGYTDIIKLLKNAGAGLDDTGQLGGTALHYAVYKVQMESVKLLLEMKASIDPESTAGTPFLLALAQGQEKIAELLLNSKASVHSKDEKLDTPLHYAAEGGYLKIVKQLIRQGASVDATGTNNRMPLHCAIQSGNPQIVELLLEKKAPVNAKLDEDARIYETSRQSSRDVRLNIGNKTPLGLALCFKNHHLIELLIKYGARTDQIDSNNKTKNQTVISEEVTDSQTQNRSQKEKLTNKCSACAKEGKLLTCSRCKTTQYCGQECQRKDWPKHKISCTPQLSS